MSNPGQGIDDWAPPSAPNAASGGVDDWTAPHTPQAHSPGLADTAVDMARSVPGGLAQGVASVAGLPGDVGHLEGRAASWLASQVDPSLGNAVDNGIGWFQNHVSDYITPTSQTINNAFSAPTSGYYQPKTNAGHLAQTAASFVPALFGGEASLPSRFLTRVVAPATGSDVAGGLTKGTPAEPYARAAGALVGGFANPSGLRTAGQFLGDTAASILGNVTTGAGANAVRGAFNAGLDGGPSADAFKGALRGTIPMESVVTDAKAALANMRAQRGAAYRSGMVDISNDPTILDFNPIDNALARANSIKNFKGQDLSPNTAQTRADITDAIDHWRQLDPAQFHTPEGIDALKQQIGDIRDAQPFHTPQRLIADQAYGAIRQTIADQAPTYDKVMGGYSQASDAIDNIQRELSLGPKGNPNTALRKLQSVMRDNANTSWGTRTKLADTLSSNGAPNLIPTLAGHALSSFTPRGLGQLGALGDLGAIALTHNPAAMAMLPLTSPRIVGEGAHALGTALRYVRNARGATGIPQAGQVTQSAAPSLSTLLQPYIASQQPSGNN